MLNYRWTISMIRVSWLRQRLSRMWREIAPGAGEWVKSTGQAGWRHHPGRYRNGFEWARVAAVYRECPREANSSGIINGRMNVEMNVKVHDDGWPGNPDRLVQSILRRCLPVPRRPPFKLTRTSSVLLCTCKLFGLFSTRVSFKSNQNNNDSWHHRLRNDFTGTERGFIFLFNFFFW